MLVEAAAIGICNSQNREQSAMTTPLAGIFTPFIVPLDETGAINESELRRYIDWLIAKGVQGLYPNGSTGEFLRFTADERIRINTIACDQAAGRVAVLAGAAEANVCETLKACETYAKIGARAVAIVAPFYYRLSPDGVLAYFAEIGRQSPIDVTLYNIPMFASPIDVPTVQRLAQLPRIIGIKDSSGDMALMLRLMAAVQPQRPDFLFFTGWEAAMAPMLLMGCQGSVNATSGVVPELTGALFQAARTSAIDEARRLQFRLNRVFDVMIAPLDFPDGFRLGVGLRGFKMGVGRQPLGPIQLALRKSIEEKLRAILTEFGYLGAN